MSGSPYRQSDEQPAVTTPPPVRSESPVQQRKGPRTSIIAGTGSLAPLSRPARSPADEPSSPSPSPPNVQHAATPLERVKFATNGALSARGLAPLGARPAIGTPASVKSAAHTSPPGNSNQSFLAGLHSSTAAHQPSAAPTAAYGVPSSSGVIVALHVGEKTFLTSPETLLRVTALEGSPMSGKARDVSLLLWIGEDAIMKFRESLAESRSGSSLGQADSPTTGSMQQKRRAENNTAEPSPRHDRFLSQAFDARSVAQMNIATSSTSSILHGSHLDFHAPTFSYFVDRSPIAFPYVLDYLRNGAGPTRSALAHITDAELHALHIDADFFQLGVLSSLVSSEQSRRHSTKFLSQEDLFWREVCETIDQLYPMQDAIALPTSPTTDGLTPVAGSSTAAQAGASPMKGTATNEYSPLEKISVGNGISGSSSSGSMTQRSAHSHSHPAARSIGNMLRRLAFSKDPMLRVCHGTYAGKPDYEERLLEILHTTCTLCRRQIFLKPIGLREGRDTGCPVHPASAQWDRKARMWSCCGSPEFANSGCQFTGIHYTTWVFWNSDDRD